MLLKVVAVVDPLYIHWNMVVVVVEVEVAIVKDLPIVR